jgi:hypothetical protein
MTERDPIEQPLMLARTTTWAPEAAKARVLANLASSGALSAASAARAVGAVRTGGVTKLTTALWVGASFIAGYWLGFQRSAEPRAAVNEASAARQPEPALEAQPARGLAARRDAEPAATAAVRAADAMAAPSDADTERRAIARATPPPRARATPGPAQLARAPAASRDPVADELMLLSRAERAIRAGEPALALSFLDELEARFPSSGMLEERSAARLLADCALSTPGSQRRAELFLSHRAASVYTDRLRRSCGLEAPSATPLPPAPLGADGSSRSGH